VEALDVACLGLQPACNLTVTAPQPVRAGTWAAQFQAVGSIDPVILRLKAATANRVREYLRADDGARLGVPIIAR
jgi:hypothetical protein